MVNLTPSREKKLRARIKRHIEPDLIDFKAHWDSTLTEKENMSFIVDEAKNLSATETERTRHDLNLLQIEQAKYGEECRRKESESVLRKWQKQSLNITSLVDHPAYSQLKAYVEMTIKGDYSTGAFIVSEGGLGKSTTVIKIVEDYLKPHEFAYLNNFTTPLAFYKYLYKHRSHKLIILDDIDDLFKPKYLSILKAVLFDVKGIRTVSWETTSNKIGDVPPRFVVDANIIIIANQISRRNANSDAVISRLNFLHIKLTYDEKMELIRFIAENGKYKDLTDEQRMNAYEFLEKNTDESTKNLSFRTLIKIYDFMRYSNQDWEVLSLGMLDADQRIKSFLDIYNNFEGTVKERLTEFNLRTGYGRKAWYSLERRLKPKENHSELVPF